MSWYREWVWTCDFCQTVVRQREQGLPTGWQWEPSGMMGIVHRCGECTQEDSPATPRND